MRFVKAQEKEFKQAKRGKDEWDKEYDKGKVMKESKT